MEKVYMTAYDANSMPNENITADGINFKWNEPFFLICNKPLEGKLYFELTISKYYPIAAFHNIPLYIGVSREASFGTLNADFCIGSLYYENGKNYDIQEKYNASGTNTHTSPTSIYTRIPGATDIIGVGVDVPNNTITFYNNGNAFYSFSPSEFHLSSHKFYFCIYSDIFYKEITYDDKTTNEEKNEKYITGYINFGKTSTVYTPSGYTSIYGYYYKRTNYEYNLLIDANISSDVIYDRYIKNLDLDCTDVQGAFENKSILLSSNSPNVNLDGFKYNITADKTISDQVLYGANVFLNLPIPTDRKIYIEMTATKGTLLGDIIGIPLSFGLSNLNTSVLSKSHRMNLHHQKQAYYNYEIIDNFIQTIYSAGDMDTSIIPTQGKLIGLLFDLANNQFSIYIDKVLFYTVKSTSIDFSNRLNKQYFFIHDDGVFDGILSGEINVGQEDFDMTLPDGSISLYDYYNVIYKELLAITMLIDGIVKIDNIRSVALFLDTFLDTSVTDSIDPTQFGNLSILFNQSNTITDQETHITGDITSVALNNIIASDNNGYYPETTIGASSIQYDEDTTIKMYTVTIEQSKNQVITVVYNGNSYTDQVIVPAGSEIKINIKASNGYDPGVLNPKSPFIVSSNKEIYATDATIHQYTIGISQYKHQSIVVMCNGRAYTKSFNTSYGSKYTATIVADDGYSTGNLNYTSGTITDDINIFATPSYIKLFNVSIVQGEHYKLGVKYNGIEYTKSFIGAYNYPINIYIISVDEGYIAPEIDNPIQIIKGDTTISYPDAGEDLCTITIVGSYHGSALINDKLGSIYAFRKGDTVAINVVPTDGYYIDSMDLSPQ